MISGMSYDFVLCVSESYVYKLSVSCCDTFSINFSTSLFSFRLDAG